MPRLRILFLSAATLTLLNISVVAQAQYYPPPPSRGYSPPPCQAVTPGPFQGAARGAAGGALIGAISGNAGRGAAIGAGFGAVRSAVRRGSARSAGACYRDPDADKGGNEENIRLSQSAGMLSQRMRATVCSTTATIGNAAHATGARSPACTAGHVRSADCTGTMGCRTGVVLGPAWCCR